MIRGQISLDNSHWALEKQGFSINTLRVKIFVTLLAALLLTACVTTGSTDEVVRFFNDIGFFGSPGAHPMSGKVLAETAYTKHRIYRWEDDLRVEVRGVKNEDFSRQIAELLDRMSELTGLRYEMLAPGQGEGNFRIEFLSKEGFLVQKTEYVPCNTRFRKLKEKILKVEIQISVEKPEILRHCIAHEMFHAFGFGHSNVLPSVVNSKMREEQLTHWDKIALKTLYDPRLQANMTRMEALPIAREIIMGLTAQSR